MLEELSKIIQDRKKRRPKDSYVASLFRKGENRILQKVGEEAIEVIIAAKGKNKKRITSEIADLWFHILVLMGLLEISLQDIYKELEKRKGVKKRIKND